MGTFLEQLCGISTVSGVQKALRCQKAEHTFADTPCGIMDQYISAMGQANNLLLIDCRSNEATLVPFGGSAPGTAVNSGEDSPIILVTNSKVKHQLSGSEYPDRVKQCQEAVKILQSKYPNVKQLRDATQEMVENLKGDMSDVVYRRARHCVSEDMRTLAAVEALKRNDFETVGRLMTESHYSLQMNYEVSCPELDLLVKIANQVKGVYGSRMTGGGFGGCTVTLVKRDAAPELIHHLHEAYWKQGHLKCETYECVPSSGAGVLPDLASAIDTVTRDETFNAALPPWIEYAEYILPVALAVSVAVGALFLFQGKK